VAIWIRAHKTRIGSKVETVYPMNGETFSIREMRNYTGGIRVAPLQMNHGHFMWVNADEKESLPVNLVADILAHQDSGIPLAEHITGDVLLANREESGLERIAYVRSN
jgi:hypothetical protein